MSSKIQGPVGTCIHREAAKGSTSASGGEICMDQAQLRLDKGARPLGHSNCQYCKVWATMKSERGFGAVRVQKYQFGTQSRPK